MLKFVKGISAPEGRHKRGWFKTILVFFTLCVVTLGQWNGARMMVESVYVNFVTHFTNHIEYQELEQVRVGANVVYLETIFGAARLIKPSPTTEGLDYRYYHSKKYLLALAVKESRVAGFQVIALSTSFQPFYIFRDTRLNAAPLAEQFLDGADFETDNANLRFYMEVHQLGREGLFASIYPATVSYGARPPELTDLEYFSTIDALYESYVLSDEDGIKRNTAQLRQRLPSNSYSFGHISLKNAVEMTLTEFEFLAYFKRSY